jgi:hypothetical protein
VRFDRPPWIDCRAPRKWRRDEQLGTITLIFSEFEDPWHPCELCCPAQLLRLDRQVASRRSADYISRTVRVRRALRADRSTCRPRSSRPARLARERMLPAREPPRERRYRAAVDRRASLAASRILSARTSRLAGLGDLTANNLPEDPRRAFAAVIGSGGAAPTQCAILSMLEVAPWNRLRLLSDLAG